MKKMTFARHETFHFREGWLTKALRLLDAEGRDLFRKNNAMELLGIGNNMVKSLRYWMQATYLTVESAKGKKDQELTDVGKLVFEYDRYIEHELTLWLIHYHLVTNKEISTTWYWFYNVFEHNEFDEELFINELTNFIDKTALEDNNATKKSKGSLKRDYDCLINTYVRSKHKQLNPEQNIACPLQELNLLEVSDSKRKQYIRKRKTIDTVPKKILEYVIYIMLSNRQTDVLSVHDLLEAECSIGKVFNVNLAGLVEILEIFQEEEILSLDRTAGLNKVYFRKPKEPNGFLRSVYEKFSGQEQAL